MDLILLAAVSLGRSRGRGPGRPRKSAYSSVVSKEWTRLLLGACRHKPSNLESAVTRLVEARGGLGGAQDGGFPHESQGSSAEAAADGVLISVKAEADADALREGVDLENEEIGAEEGKLEEGEEREDGEELGNTGDKAESNDKALAEVSTEASADGSPSEEQCADEKEDGESSAQGNNEADDQEDLEDDDRAEDSSIAAASGPEAMLVDSEEATGEINNEQDEEGVVTVPGAARGCEKNPVNGPEAVHKALLVAAADELLYELHMAEPIGFQDCVENDLKRYPVH